MWTPSRPLTMALSLRRLSSRLALPNRGPHPQQAQRSIVNDQAKRQVRPCFSRFQSTIFQNRLRKYCTFKDINDTPSAIAVEEVEEIEEEVLDDEIPLVESHWDAFENELRHRLEQRLQGTNVEIWDKTRPNCGVVLEIHVTSSKFVGISKIEATRLVTSSLQGLVDDVHALTIKTRTPS